MSNESHSFSVKVAKEVGVPCAIMLQHLLFLQKVNAANNRKAVPETWVRRSVRELSDTYEYYTPKQIRAIIDTLLKGEYIFEQSENENKRDRSKSYKLTKKGFLLLGEEAFAQMVNCICPNGQMDLPKRSNVICPNGQMLSYNSYNIVIENSDNEKISLTPEKSTDNEHKNFSLEEDALSNTKGAAAPPSAVPPPSVPPLTAYVSTPHTLEQCVDIAKRFMQEQPATFKNWHDLAKVNITGKVPSDFIEDITKFFSHYLSQHGPNSLVSQSPKYFFETKYYSWIHNSKLYGTPKQNQAAPVQDMPIGAKIYKRS